MEVSATKTLHTLPTLERTCKPYDPIEVMNNAEDEPTEINCSVCKNKGVIYYLDGIYEMCRDCECMSARRSLKRIERSGLKDALEKCTFKNFVTEHDYQTVMKEKAGSYIKNYHGNWFFIGGQVGCGKTHICTAIVRKLLIGENKNTRYLPWRDVVPKIKAKANSDEYEELLKPWKTVEVLYIDDLFKTAQGQKPTTADINIAYEILNYRYPKSGLITIISSELTIKQITEIEQSIGSRIFEKSGNYCINIGKDIKKNYRLKNMF